MTLSELNQLAPDEAARLLLQACASSEWARQLSAQRPFTDMTALLDDADRVWLGLGEVDWFEAFGAHPRIGERASSAFSQQEQARALTAGDQVRQALAQGNAEYEQRFGFIFLVSASGRSSEEILEILRRRMSNDRGTEIRNAVGEQMKITRLRLQKLVQLI
jgi:2-oxo-4-hydroxy-4-carboxy-5-ureidoimidazoline decarboxylase